MVWLPFAASSGQGSLLNTLVEAHVPVETFGCPTVKSIIDFKWRKFAQNKIYGGWVVRLGVRSVQLAVRARQCLVCVHGRAGAGWARRLAGGLGGSPCAIPFPHPSQHCLAAAGPDPRPHRPHRPHRLYRPQASLLCTSCLWCSSRCTPSSFSTTL